MTNDLNKDWLDVKDTAGNKIVDYLQTVPPTTTTHLNTPTMTYWPYLNKIQLTLTEIEFLREEAKKSKRLKEILNKFTHHIDVVVDF